MCLPCADDEPCAVDRVGKPREIPDFEPEQPPAPVIARTPEELGLPRVGAPDREERATAGATLAGGFPAMRANRDARAARRDGVVEKTIRGETVRMSAYATQGPEMIDLTGRVTEMRPGGSGHSTRRIPDAVMAAIRVDRAQGMTLADLAKKHGVSQSSVEKACAGMKVPRGARKPNAERKPGQKAITISGAPPAIDRMLEAVQREPGDEAPVRVRVDVELDPQRARAILNGLTARQQGVALTAVLMEMLG